MYRIMIVEDDEVIAGAIRQNLIAWGIKAFCVQDFSAVVAELAANNPDQIAVQVNSDILCSRNKKHDF